MGAASFVGPKVMLSAILDTNFGVWPFTICRMPGPNLWKMLIPASLPIVEPKLLDAPKWIAPNMDGER
jgi:hypothetical protein